MIKHIKILILSIFLCSCSSSIGKMNQSTGTGVSLKKNNYKIVKAGARGDSSGLSLLCMIPIFSPIFAEAKEDLYESVGQKLEGRSIALANQTEDETYSCLILFGIRGLTITADVVEFHEDSKSSNIVIQ